MTKTVVVSQTRSKITFMVYDEAGKQSHFVWKKDSAKRASYNLQGFHKAGYTIQGKAAATLLTLYQSPLHI